MPCGFPVSHPIRAILTTGSKGNYSPVVDPKRLNVGQEVPSLSATAGLSRPTRPQYGSRTRFPLLGVDRNTTFAGIVKGKVPARASNPWSLSRPPKQHSARGTFKRVERRTRRDYYLSNAGIIPGPPLHTTGIEPVPLAGSCHNSLFVGIGHTLAWDSHPGSCSDPQDSTLPQRTFRNPPLTLFRGLGVTTTPGTLLLV